MDVEEAKSQLRVEEIEADAERCPACAAARSAEGDPTTYCDNHTRWILLGGAAGPRPRA